jgi:hypothetical protein
MSATRLSHRLFGAALASILAGGLVGAVGLGAEAAPPPPTAFEQAFAAPADDTAKPFVRWWIAPGRMTEPETRKEIQNFADGGFGGVELVSLELNTVDYNSPGWNEAMLWILDEADRQGLQVDVTLGVVWPISTPEIADPYADTRAEQKLALAAVDFTAAAGAMEYSQTDWQFPAAPPYNPPPGCPPEWCPPPAPPLDTAQPWELVAVTAAKRISTDGTNSVYDPATSADLTSLVEPGTGAVAWTAPSEGDWTVFYSYQQSTGRVPGYGVDTPVVDHMSAAATQAIIQSFEDAFAGTPGLKDLYRRVGGSFFGDSLELSSVTHWSDDLVAEFEARRGYDVTPYIPAVYAASGLRDVDAAVPYDFQGIGSRVRQDLAQTISELFHDNHLRTLSEWAQRELGMDVRYQSYHTNGVFFFDRSIGALGSDVPETESLGGDSLDNHRQVSGVAHLKGSPMSAEAAESGDQDWRQTWTGSLTEAGDGSTDLGFMRYTGRLFAAGVNRLILHGASYKVTDFSNMYFGPVAPEWPGYSMMGGMSYSNEWDDKTPLWAHVNTMTDYLSRAQTVLQQGKADVDLAYYRQFTSATDAVDGLQEIDRAGYTMDYLSPALLALPQATVARQGGHAVLAPDGPSYKALVLDQRRSGGTTQPYTMPVATAQAILSFAQAGLPVVVVGDAPTTTGAYPGDAAAMAAADAELAGIMARLQALPTTALVADAADVAGRTGVAAALADLGVTPDARPAAPSPLIGAHRAGAGADFYFLTNDDAAAPLAQAVTLRGAGRPYLLDAWSGEATPIAEYTAADGTITVDVVLDPSEQVFIALAGPGWFAASPDLSATATTADSLFYDADGVLSARTSSGGANSATLASGEVARFLATSPDAPLALGDGDHEWTFTLHEWTSAVDPSDPSYAQRFLETTVEDSAEHRITDLVPWHDIDPAELAQAAGVGEYTTEFTLARGWAEGQGARLDFDRVTDVMRVWVNGHEVHPDQIAKRADIGRHLVQGTNTLVVKVVSNMANVKYQTQPKFANLYQFGVIGAVTVTPYSVTPVVPPPPPPPPPPTTAPPSQSPTATEPPGPGPSATALPGAGASPSAAPLAWAAALLLLFGGVLLVAASVERGRGS